MECPTGGSSISGASVTGSVASTKRRRVAPDNLHWTCALCPTSRAPLWVKRWWWSWWSVVMVVGEVMIRYGGQIWCNEMGRMIPWWLMTNGVVGHGEPAIQWVHMGTGGWLPLGHRCGDPRVTCSREKMVDSPSAQAQAGHSRPPAQKGLHPSSGPSVYTTVPTKIRQTISTINISR